MIARAIARYLRISARKTRKVMDLVRGMPVIKAEVLLDSLNKRPCLYIKRVLRSAIDSADKKSHIPVSSLYISLIKADQGPMIKRFRAATMGRATMIKHRTTHITLELEKIKEAEKKAVTPAITEGKTKRTLKKPKEMKIGTKSTPV